MHHHIHHFPYYFNYLTLIMNIFTGKKNGNMGYQKSPSIPGSSLRKNGGFGGSGGFGGPGGFGGSKGHGSASGSGD